VKTQPVTYFSDGTRVEGLLQLPDQLATGERRAAVIICSGMQGLKEWVPARWWPSFVAAGYICLAFDYRGFGTSGGERGRFVPLEEVEDVQSSITFLQQQSQIDPGRIGLLGWGLGGGIVIETAARDPRVQAVACVNGLGDAGRATRDAVPYPVWQEWQDRIAKDRVERVLTGRSAKVPYREMTHPGSSGGTALTYAQFDRDLQSLGRDPIDTFSLAACEAYCNFKPERVVDRISPRPVLIAHGERNDFMPIDEAQSLYAKAKEPKELLIVPGAKHLEWIAPESPIREIYMGRIVDWFCRHLPAGAV
jgi:alpha-beta hydrolase superfamily lysophospholipase